MTLSSATRATKDAALLAMADSLAKSETAILEANARDVTRAEANGTSAALIDRLRLTPDRIAGMVEGYVSWLRCPIQSATWYAAGPTPTGAGPPGSRAVRCRRHHLRGAPQRHRRRWRHLPEVGQRRLLRGSSSAAESNAAVVEALQAGLVDAGLPAEAIQLVPGPREVTNELMAARGLVDVLIPRGGAGLIDNVVRNSQVPVIETGVGNCHLFVDASADEQMALNILINAKAQRPSVCNAARRFWCTPTSPTLSCRRHCRRSPRTA